MYGVLESTRLRVAAFAVRAQWCMDSVFGLFLMLCRSSEEFLDTTWSGTLQAWKAMDVVVAAWVDHILAVLLAPELSYGWFLGVWLADA